MSPRLARVDVWRLEHYSRRNVDSRHYEGPFAGAKTQSALDCVLHERAWHYWDAPSFSMWSHLGLDDEVYVIGVPREEDLMRGFGGPALETLRAAGYVVRHYQAPRVFTLEFDDRSTQIMVPADALERVRRAS